MQTVRVWDALRYASKFVGLVLAVVIVAGGFLAGGAYLAADAISFTDPSFSALSETPVFIGIVLLAVGAILGAIGWIALAYKFLADGVAAAMAVRGVGDETGEPASADAETEESADAAESVAGPSSSGVAASTDDGPSQADDERTAASGVSATGTTGAADSGAPATPDPDQQGDTGSTSSPGTETRSGPAETAVTPEPAVDEDDDRREVDSVDEEPAVEDGSPQESEPEDPPEWTPPDPSEFETGGSTDSDGTDSVDQWADETTDLDHDGAHEAATDADEANRSAASPDPDDIAEDATLADEGVESFSATSEEDPLSDRLPGSDDN